MLRAFNVYLTNDYDRNPNDPHDEAASLYIPPLVIVASTMAKAIEESLRGRVGMVVSSVNDLGVVSAIVEETDNAA